MRLWQDEEGHKCFVVIWGYSPDLEAPDSVGAPALITAIGCVQTVFGYPNEDAFLKDPRGELDHGCFEIEGSKWMDHVDEYNRRSFGTDYSPSPGDPPHHYFIGSKDGSCQVLAKQLDVEVFPGLSFREISEIVEERNRQEFAEILGEIKAMQEGRQPPE
jgi:hypothetical protein